MTCAIKRGDAIYKRNNKHANANDNEALA